ncbi:mitochondrial 37S ribosomal protein bS16m [Aspergillus lucknowensis]|uniref:Ribosomal protein S16 n=1 Tax=Aspergillus lucknowensis TaxID=176173 RepID=A0ABR4LUH2_9EURO
MVVRIRLSRFGNRHQTFYNIVVSQARYGSPCVHGLRLWLDWSSEACLPEGRQPSMKRNWADPKLVEVYRSARDSKPLEVIGTFNPYPQRPTNLSDEEARNARPYKDISLDKSRAKYWLGVGAQPSDTVWRILSLVRSEMG